MRRAIRTDFWLIIGFAIAMILLTPGAWGNGNHDRNSHHDSASNSASQSGSESHAVSGAIAGAAAGALAAGTGGDATAMGGAGGEGGRATSKAEGGQGGLAEGGTGGTASNDGNTYDTRNSNFYVSRSLPASANPCITSTDAGGGGKSGAGFLGIQLIDDNCWKNTLAEQERNAELKALLKCGAKKYRRSVAYAQPRDKQQGYCVGYVKAIYVAEIALELEAMEKSHKRALEIIAAQSEGTLEGK